MNKAIVMGHLARDPELKYGASGKAYANGCVAVRRERAKEGQQDVDFINFIIFGKGAELVTQYLCKGSPILLEGRIQIDVVDRDGSKRYYTKLVADRFHFCGGGKRKDESSRTSLPSEGIGEDDDIFGGDDGVDPGPAELPGGEDLPDAPELPEDDDIPW